jgi:RNA polymerase sigma-70 factor (ECF subfamily)
LKISHTYANYSDAELVECWLKGNEIAFNALHSRYAGRLLHIAIQKTNSREAATELVQEVFMELYLHRHTLERGACLYGYLFTILSNKIYNNFRRLLIEKKYLEHIRFLNGATEPGLEKRMENKELKTKVETVIRNLPPRCKSVFLLKWDQQLSNKEISAFLNISVNTVEQHIRKARNELRKSLGNYEWGLIITFFISIN